GATSCRRPSPGGLTRTTTNLIDGNSAMSTTTVDATVVGSGGTVRRGACNQSFRHRHSGADRSPPCGSNGLKCLQSFPIGGAKKIFTRPPHLGEAAWRGGG